MFKPFELIVVIALTVTISLLTVFVTKNTGEGKEITPIINLSTGATRSGDDRYSMAPRPQRVWDNGPEIPLRGSILDPIATRGPPEAYQQMGVLTTEDGKALPLYGRRTAPRSDRFNYYTRTDTYNPVAIPVGFKKRDCQDGVGCDEVMSGDEVHLSAVGGKGKVTLYGFDGPRYA